MTQKLHTWAYISEKNDLFSNKNCTWTLRVALFVITQNCKVPKYSSVGKWVKKEKQNVVLSIK